MSDTSEEIVNALHDRLLDFWSLDDDVLVKDFLTELGRYTAKLIIEQRGIWNEPDPNEAQRAREGE